MPVEGLTIRRAEPDDYAAVYEIYSCPKAYAGTLQLPYPSREHWRKRMAEPDDANFMLVAVAGDRVVGLVGLHLFPKLRRRHAATLGIGIHDDWQGKGVGSALMCAALDLADNWLNLRRLELEVYTDNEAAIRLYERFGFEHEGTLRQHAFRDGQYVDSYMMARLRSAAENS
jgi:putative acetyltransferase